MTAAGLAMSAEKSDGGDGTDAAALQLDRDQKRKARTGWVLVVNGCLFFVGWMLGQAAEQEIWLRHYNGGGLLTAASGRRSAPR